MNISVCTIYAKRELHLQNLVTGLMWGNLSPKELVIVCMNDSLPQLPQTSFPIRTTTINTDNNRLPLAAARNKAATMASGEKLIFLDVDCICDRNLVGNFDYHLTTENFLYQGSVRYLHSGWQRTKWTPKILHQQSSSNKLQGAAIQEKDKIRHPYEMFWSVCFGIRKKTFLYLGGFDERYIGYGGEDTDFAFTVRSQSLPLYKISALAYHQFHPTYDPPLNHFQEIISNARVFYDKWCTLPMKRWLEQFAAMGYIKLRNNTLEIVKYPTKEEILACQKDY